MIVLSVTLLAAAVSCGRSGRGGPQLPQMVEASVHVLNNMNYPLRLNISAGARNIVSVGVAASDSINLSLGPVMENDALTFTAADEEGVSVSIRRNIAVGTGRLVWIIP